jgi:two-component system OmpR family response regulator
MRVLLVEDDPLIGRAIEQALHDEAIAVNWVQDGQTAIDTAQLEKYSLVLLDIGLPKINGLGVLSQLRKKKIETPVIIITARDAVEDRIQGLDVGADDYLVKPFSISELLARMRAVIRRHQGVSNPLLTSLSLQLDPATKTLIIDNKTHTLSAREFALLHTLMLKPGKIFSKDELEEQIYGWNEEVASNAIEVIIHGLRKKYGKDIIKNIRGLGWLVEK